jgi:apolipoprotein N-acyltransferase
LHIGLFILAALSYFFSTGKNAIPLAGWLAPAFILLYINQASKKKRALLFTFLMILVLFYIKWTGYIPAPFPIYQIVCFGYCLFIFLPYLLHGLFYRKDSFLSTLIAPLSVVAVEYAWSIFSPFSSWGSTAYSMMGSNELLQVLSLTGVYGVGFFLYWFGSTICFLVDHRFNLSTIKKPAILVSSMILLVLVYGSYRLHYQKHNTATVKVAGITVPLSPTSLIFQDIDYVSEVGKPITSYDNLFLDLFILNKVFAADQKPMVQSWFKQTQDSLIRLTEREAQNGAKIILWSEGNGVVLKEDETAFMQRISETAKANKVFLIATLNTKEMGKRLSENKIVAFDDKGRQLFQYFKSNPVPGVENSVAGDKVVRTIETPYGRVASVICFDADFPQMIRQASQKDADILLVPGYDWEDINPYHTYMSSLRGIENGFSVVRQASNGWSAAFDNRGQQLSSMNYNTAPEKVTISYVPQQSSKTLYAVAGDWFAVTCVTALVLLLAYQMINRKHKNKPVVKPLVIEETVA